METYGVREIKGMKYARPKDYYRVRMEVAVDGGPGKKVSFWAIKATEKHGLIVFREVSKEGNEDFYGGKNEDGVEISQVRLFLGSEHGIISMKPAHMNLHYGELEVIK